MGFYNLMFSLNLFQIVFTTSELSAITCSGPLCSNQWLWRAPNKIICSNIAWCYFGLVYSVKIFYAFIIVVTHQVFYISSPFVATYVIEVAWRRVFTTCDHLTTGTQGQLETHLVKASIRLWLVHRMSFLKVGLYSFNSAHAQCKSIFLGSCRPCILDVPIHTHA